MSRLGADMAVIEIVPARASHLRRIAAVMRQADRDEVAASSGRSPLAALSYSFRMSRECWAVVIDGKPEVIFGVGDLNILGGVGSPWLLGSDAVWDHRREFMRQSREWLAQLFARYSVLRNVVDCRNSASIRWLGWLGFRFSQPFDLRGNPFMMFEMRA